MIRPEYVPSVRCRIFGHKWNFVEKRIRPKVRSNDPNEQSIIDTLYTPLPHCHHCGVPNPNFEHAKESR